MDGCDSADARPTFHPSSFESGQKRHYPLETPIELDFVKEKGEAFAPPEIFQRLLNGAVVFHFFFWIGFNGFRLILFPKDKVHDDTENHRNRGGSD